MDDNWGDWNDHNIIKTGRDDIMDQVEQSFLQKLRLPTENPFDVENNFSKTDKFFENEESEDLKKHDDIKKDKQNHSQIWEDVIESSVYDN